MAAQHVVHGGTNALRHLQLQQSGNTRALVKFAMLHSQACRPGCAQHLAPIYARLSQLRHVHWA